MQQGLGVQRVRRCHHVHHAAGTTAIIRTDRNITGNEISGPPRPAAGDNLCRVSDSAICRGQSQTDVCREKSSVMSATINASVPIASPLVFAERLIALAIEADQSGFSAAARRLVATAHSVLDRPSAPPLSRPTQDPVGLPIRTAAIHASRFGADGQRGARGPSLADCERLAINRLAAH